VKIFSIFIQSRFFHPETISLSFFRKQWLFLLLQTRRWRSDVDGSLGESSTESSTSGRKEREREREREIPFYHGFSLTNATQVRLFNAASVRSEAFSQDEWDDRLSPGTNSRKLRFIVARRCLLPRYDTYGGSLTHSTNPLPPPSLRFSAVCNEIRMTITSGM